MIERSQIPLCAVFRISSGERYLYVSRTNRIHLLKGHLNTCPGAEVPSAVSPAILPRGPFCSIKCRIDGCGGSLSRFDGKRRCVIFELTQQCNLRCDYCVYSGNYGNMRKHCQKAMSWDDLKLGLDRFAHDSRKLTACEISFYGGETMLEFDLLKQAIAYSRVHFPGRTLSFSVSTNGILLTPERMLWLSDNPDVSVMITVNGPFHDRWRHHADGTGSLSVILKNVDWAKANLPHVWERQIDFICNIASLKQVNPMRDFYRRTIGKCPKIITRIERDRGNDYIHELLGEENDNGIKENLFAEYLRTGDDFLHVLFGIPLSEIHDRKLFSAEDPGVSHSCIPFLNRMFVSADRRIDFCERIGKLAFGTLKDGIDETTVAAVDSHFNAFQNEKCRFCWAQRLCTLCYKDLEHLVEGHPTVSENFCREMKQRSLDNLKEYCEVVANHPEIRRRINAISEAVKAKRSCD